MLSAVKNDNPVMPNELSKQRRTRKLPEQDVDPNYFFPIIIILLLLGGNFPICLAGL
ncbi:hypothetical protein K440DRAFT_620343, partial [Wilcoxina mikolae CBS 423.85]